MSDFDWRTATDARMGNIENRLTEIEKSDAVSEVHHKNVETRLSSIEGTLVWLVRLIIGGLVLAVLGFAFSGGFTKL